MFSEEFKNFFNRFQVMVLGWKKYRTLRRRLHPSKTGIFPRENNNSKMDATRIHGSFG